MYYLDNPLPDDDYNPPVTLKKDHIGKHVDGGYVIKEQFPYGCLALSSYQPQMKEVKTYSGHTMVTGYVDRKWVPLCELETFA